LCCGDRGLVRRRGGKVKAAFPPGSSVVNRYNVKRRMAGKGAIPSKYLVAFGLSGCRPSDSSHRYGAAEYVKRFSV
jgi:hypothetical protein